MFLAGLVEGMLSNSSLNVRTTLTGVLRHDFRVSPAVKLPPAVEGYLTISVKELAMPLTCVLQ